MREVFFKGPEGRLVAKYSESSNKKAPLALVLHPNSKYEGTMDNTVVYHIFTTLVANGYTVLRINFRGVGRSQGQYDNGIGEITDAATALDWLQSNHPFSSGNLIAGFSSGAWIAMQLIMRRPEINNFIAVAPPVSVKSYDFSFLNPCPIPGLIIQGDRDSVVQEKDVLDLAHKLSKQKVKVDYKMISGADHYFRNNIDDLKEAISSYLQTNSSQQKFVQSSLDDVTETINETSKQKVFLD